MICPNCNSENSFVKSTYKMFISNKIGAKKRYRICNECYKPFITFEFSDNLTVEQMQAIINLSKPQ